MGDTWNLAWAIFAVWLNTLLDHASQPTWANILTVLVVWFVVDLIGVIWRFFRTA